MRLVASRHEMSEWCVGSKINALNTECQLKSAEGNVVETATSVLRSCFRLCLSAIFQTQIEKEQSWLSDAAARKLTHPHWSGARLRAAGRFEKSKTMDPPCYSGDCWVGGKNFEPVLAGSRRSDLKARRHE